MRTHHVIFVVGMPGAGKTSALRKLALPSDHQTDDTEVRWTVTAPYAFIGHYENKTLDGGDRVARHANLLCLEYWKRYILPREDISYTFIDGEMYLWSRILEEFQGDLDFVRDTDNYKPGGRYHMSFSQICKPDTDRFPGLEPTSGPTPKVALACVFLKISDEESLRRRRQRAQEAGEGETVNSDRHMKTAGSKQRNFAARFKEEARVPFFMAELSTPMDYHEFDAGGLTMEETAAALERYALSLSESA